MGGLFGVSSRESCVLDLFFGVDYHSHLGTARGGMAVLGQDGFGKIIHNIQNAPFRTKFENELDELCGRIGIGCISDMDSQPLVVRSHLGEYAITCVGKINNEEELVKAAFKDGGVHFLESGSGQVNAAELVATLIDGCDSFAEGIRRVHERVDGSMTILIADKDGVIAARDKYGRTPMIIGGKDGSYCAASESFAYLNLGYHTVRELGPGEIVRLTPDGVEQLAPPGDQMRICAFLWTYYGYPSSTYEGVNVENMRYRCGEYLAMRYGDLQVDAVAGVPDSGTAYAIGYSNASGAPFTRPFVKYTPTWPRSFTPRDQRQRDLIAKMKLIPVDELISGKELLFIEDSIVRGTQLRETVDLLYDNGAKQVHIRVACPPLLFGCKYIAYSRQRTVMELITRRIIQSLEGRSDDETASGYVDPDGERNHVLVREIKEQMGFSSLGFLRLDDLTKACSVSPCKLCTYCWSGKE